MHHCSQCCFCFSQLAMLRKSASSTGLTRWGRTWPLRMGYQWCSLLPSPSPTMSLGVWESPRYHTQHCHIANTCWMVSTLRAQVDTHTYVHKHIRYYIIAGSVHKVSQTNPSRVQGQWHQVLWRLSVYEYLLFLLRGIINSAVYMPGLRLVIRKLECIEVITLSIH